MLSEISQTQKKNIKWFYWYKVPRIDQFTDTGKTEVPTEGEENGELLDFE